MGHLFGLPHPFLNGCSDNNDGVDDTPASVRPTRDSFCPESDNMGFDSCPNMPGQDPFKNFMHYAPQTCRTMFTEGQIIQMHDIMHIYRPTLLATWKNNSANTIAAYEYPNITTRLVGTGASFGRLEVFRNLTGWGTVCGQQFNQIDATVACQSLGFESGAKISYTPPMME